MTMAKLAFKRRLRTVASVAGTAMALIAVCVIAAPPTKITSEVASTADLTAEVHLLLTTLEPAVTSDELYSQRQDQIRRQAIQVAILAQASVDHDASTTWKGSANDLRAASLGLARAESQGEAAKACSQAIKAFESKESDPVIGQSSWGQLASNGTLMSIMKERTELIRKGLRKSKDSAVESRHAMVVALLVLAVHENTHAIKNPTDKATWQQICREVQENMSRAAISIRDKDPRTAADHFRLGMEACDQCHLRFKS